MSQQLATTFTQLALALTVGIGLVLVIRTINRVGNVPPFTSFILNAIKPLAYKGILAAFKTTDDIFQEFETRIDNLDRKAIADSVYDLLPRVVWLSMIPVPVKTFVRREDFQFFTETLYQDFKVFNTANRNFFRSQITAEIPGDMADVTRN